MGTDTPVGSVHEVPRAQGVAELELPVDDLDIVASALPQDGSDDVECTKNYCPKDYCESGYSSE